MTDPVETQTEIAPDADTGARADPRAIPPLAEGRWLWRRIYVFAVSAGIWALLAGVVGGASPTTLPRIADGLLGLLALVLVLYLVAPTTQQVIELLANLHLRVGGPEAGDRR